MRYAPGNHEGPNRADKGEYGGSCNVTACQLARQCILVQPLDAAVLLSHVCLGTKPG